MTTTEPAPVRSMGHLAFYYRPGLEEAARVLLTDLGCELVDNGYAPGQDGFSSALLDGPRANHADNLVYLGRMSEEQLRAEDALEKSLAQLGMADAWRDISDIPESRPHFGIRFHTMEALEEALLRVHEHAEPGGPLAGHVRFRNLRARPGLDADTDARIEASPVFQGDEKAGYTDYLVQCFIRNDLFGNLTSAGTIELDYAFPRFFERVPRFG